MFSNVSIRLEEHPSMPRISTSHRKLSGQIDNIETVRSTSSPCDNTKYETLESSDSSHREIIDDHHNCPTETKSDEKTKTGIEPVPENGDKPIDSLPN